MGRGQREPTYYFQNCRYRQASTPFICNRIHFTNRHISKKKQALFTREVKRLYLDCFKITLVMGPCKLKWTAEEEAAMRAGIDKHGAGKWRVILKDPQFRSVLSARSNVDLKDKWRNMQFTMNGQSRNRCKPVPKEINETSRSCDKSVALTSEGSDEDEIAEPEPPSSFNEASQEGGSEKLTRFSLEDLKTVPVDGKLSEVRQGLECDSILQAKIDAELIRIGLMNPADAAAAALAAVEKAEAAVAEAEDAEREAVEAERAAEEANAFAEELKRKLREKKARAGYAAWSQ